MIDFDGGQIGILSTRDALRLAEERGYDLVEVSPNSRPPVCKIMDYGKYKYQLSKKERISRKRQHTIQLKEMKLRPKIEEHDYQFKAKHIREFLGEGNKVKIFVVFRGREMAHREFGTRILERLQNDLSDIGAVQQPPKLEGRNLTMILIPTLNRGTKDA